MDRSKTSCEKLNRRGLRSGLPRSMLLTNESTRLRMRPGQPELNELEFAILQGLVEKRPALLKCIPRLRVIAREFTGAGSYTTFESAVTAVDLANERVGLDKVITMPGVPNGLGAL